MTKQIRISLTLTDTSYGDREIIEFIERFGSGKGNQERSFEIKRLLKVAIEQERFARNCDGSSLAGRTIRPTLFSEDVVKKRPVFNPEMPQPKSEPDIAAAAPGEAADPPAEPQAAQIQMDSAIECVPSTKNLLTSPVAKASNNPAAMLGYLMDALAAEEDKNQFKKVRN